MTPPQKRTRRQTINSRASGDATKVTPKPRQLTIYELEFCARLRGVIEAQGLSRRKVASKIKKGWTPTRVNDYMVGRRTPNFDALRELSLVLGVSTDFLIFGEWPMRRNQQRTDTRLQDDFCAMLRRGLSEHLRAVDPRIDDPTNIVINYEALITGLIADLGHQLQTVVNNVKTSNERFQRTFGAAIIIDKLARGAQIQLDREAALKMSRELMEDVHVAQAEQDIENAYKGADATGQLYSVALSQKAISILRETLPA